MSAFRLITLLGCAALFAGCGRDHLQREGRYQFRTEEVIRDECQLAAPPAAPWGGALVVSGDVVRLDFQLFDMELVGLYLASVERFSLDGSVANVSTQVLGQECLLDLVSAHVDAITDSPNAFHGSIRVNYETDRPDRCVCELWASYRASLVP